MDIPSLVPGALIHSSDPLRGTRNAHDTPTDIHADNTLVSVKVNASKIFKRKDKENVFFRKYQSKRQIPQVFP